MGHDERPDTDEDSAKEQAKGHRLQSYREQVLQMSAKIQKLRDEVDSAEVSITEQKLLLKNETATLDILLTDGRRIL